MIGKLYIVVILSRRSGIEGLGAPNSPLGLDGSFLLIVASSCFFEHAKQLFTLLKKYLLANASVLACKEGSVFHSNETLQYFAGNCGEKLTVKLTLLIIFPEEFTIVTISTGISAEIDIAY